MQVIAKPRPPIIPDASSEKLVLLDDATEQEQPGPATTPKKAEANQTQTTDINQADGPQSGKTGVLLWSHGPETANEGGSELAHSNPTQSASKSNGTDESAVGSAGWTAGDPAMMEQV